MYTSKHFDDFYFLFTASDAVPSEEIDIISIELNIFI